MVHQSTNKRLENQPTVSTEGNTVIGSYLDINEIFVVQYHTVMIMIKGFRKGT